MNNSHIVKFDANEEEKLNTLFKNEKARLMGEKQKEIASILGVNKPQVTAKNNYNDDIKPFYSDKAFAKKFKNTVAKKVYQYHTTEYWQQQADEIDQQAQQNAETLLKNESTKTSEKSSDIILR